jgi:hypothetical protein
MPGAGRTAAAVGLLCLLLAGCGGAGEGNGARPPADPSPVAGPCTPGDTTDEAGGPAGPPTDEDTGSPQPPTDEETGPARSPEPPTEEQTGPPQPPTDEETGPPQPPTDETGTADRCQWSGWTDMARDFNAYYARHRGDADTLMPANPIRTARMRMSGGSVEAVVVFETKSVGKGRGEDARRVAEVFTRWRKEVFGDKGTVSVRKADELDGSVLDTRSW